MQKRSFKKCYKDSPLILTEGAVGQRIEREYGIPLDEHIMLAGLIYQEKGRSALEAIYRQYLQIAEEQELPILLLTNTRRTNRERTQKSVFHGKNIMRDYSDFLFNLSNEYRCEAFIGGMMGCKGDAYKGDEGLSTAEAEDFHSWQVSECRDSRLDFLFAAIMPTLPETIGMAMVMQNVKLPYIISLMISMDGCLLDGTTIHDAICTIDNAVKHPPICYMTNCVHPLVLKQALSEEANRTHIVRSRFKGIQANAANLSPEQLDGSSELQTSTARELAADFMSLHRIFPMKICGGCCGTDHSHIKEIATAMKL